MLFLAKLKRSKIFSRFILSLQQRRIYGYFSCIGRKLVFSHTSFVKCNPRPTRYNEITRTPIFQTPEKPQLVSFPSEQPRLNCSGTFTLLRRSKIFDSVVSSFTTNTTMAVIKFSFPIESEESRRLAATTDGEIVRFRFSFFRRIARS